MNTYTAYLSRFIANSIGKELYPDIDPSRYNWVGPLSPVIKNGYYHNYMGNVFYLWIKEIALNENMIRNTFIRSRYDL